MPGLAAQAMANTEDARTAFGWMGATQLNWKPGPDRWSVGECLDHLLNASASYFPTFEKLLAGTREATLWQKVPGLPGLLGGLMIRYLSPDSAKKMKAPLIFQPSRSDVSRDVVARFVDQQARLLGYMQACERIDPENVVISSPVTKLVPYSLMDAFRILVVHQQRHLQQARRVTESEAFPKG